MSSMFAVLMKKQFNESCQTLRSRKPDVWGTILSLLLTAALLYLFIAISDGIIRAYIAIPVNQAVRWAEREREILTVWYFAVIVLGAMSGIRNINHALFESDDLKILATLPVPPKAVFMSKAAVVFAKQLAVITLLVIPFNVILARATGRSAEYIGTSLAASVMLTLLTVSISSFLALPVFRLKRAISSKYATMLIVLTAFLGALFWAYSFILDTFKQLLSTGMLKFFFSAETMLAIGNFTSHAYPAVFLADFTLLNDAGYNFGLIFAITAVLAVVGYFTVNRLFDKAVQSRIKRSAAKLRPQHWYADCGSFGTMLKKEFIEILRTPQYAFQCFSTALIMPLMTYFSMEVGTSLLSDTVGISMNFEVALFLIILFSVLTNTFCATNISRDGTAFYMIKTLPFSGKKYVMAKVTFSSLVSVLSVVLSAAVLGATGFTDASHTVFLLFVGVTVSVAEICFATRRDLTRPCFSEEEDNLLRQSGSTASSLVLIGTLLACLIGGGAIAINVTAMLRGGVYNELWAYLIGGLGAPAVLGAAVFYLLRKLDAAFMNTVEGGC